ncbi:hypothetical protein RJT34_24444 [Clitoria ternatea]|uniref:Uncharacterized protein n=1 Tax=Clitoria ternatea TaxID=43366 RepID=A0AAN9FWD9_CLITE
MYMCIQMRKLLQSSSPRLVLLEAFALPHLLSSGVKIINRSVDPSICPFFLPTIPCDLGTVLGEVCSGNHASSWPNNKRRMLIDPTHKN